MKFLKTLLSALTAACIVTACCFCPVSAENEVPMEASVTVETSKYEDYLELYVDSDYPSVGAKVFAKSAITENGAVLSQGGDAVIFGGSGNKASFTFVAEQSGLYNIELCYRTAAGASNLTALEIDVSIDSGIAPEYDWLKGLSLERVWEDAEEIRTDDDGNEITPEQSEVHEINAVTLKDVYSRPLYYFFESGVHTLSVEAVRGEFELYSVRVFNADEAPSYGDTLDKNSDNTQKYFAKYEAEKYSRKSSASIVPENDPADAETSPNDPIIQKLNYISGSNFKEAGAWVEWEIEVPSDGYYLIDMRVRQNYNSGLSSIRTLTVDGELPFAECEEISFPYNDSWNIQSMGADEPYRFYLTKGKHTLRLTASYGSLYQVVSFAQNIILELNSLYNSVIMKIGTNPDKYRDYNLDTEIKGIDKTLAGLCISVDTLGEMVVATNNGKTGSAMSTVQTVKTMLQLFLSDPDELALKMDTFKSNIESLASWANSLNEQPLDIDYIRVYSENTKTQNEKISFFAKLKFDITRLLASFSSDYDLYEDDTDQNKLTVWINGGRDQLKVIKKLVGSGFEEYYDTEVTLAINTDITGAILAGVGPDVCLFTDSGSPVLYAVRDVLVDLSEFEDFGEVSKRFDQGALTPFSSVGGCYALPLSVSWPMMFVRNDIFEDLGVSVPDTWDDMYTIAAVLQRNHLDIGIPSHVGMFITLLYQNGGQVFDSGLQTTFNDEYSLNAFKTWTSFFSEYSFPLTYDFFNRFRSGEMPIGIADYIVYAQLKAAAPEIRGQWSMYMIPGVEDENGNINRSMSISSATGTTSASGLLQNISSAIMFKACENKPLAWEFLKWFTDETVQSEYGVDIEAVLGYSGRYATANINAIEKLPWSSDELKMLNEARENIVFIEEYPGNYYIAREVNNAFRSVVNDGTNPADILSRKNVLINKELNRKYQQFDIKAGDGE